MDTPLKSCVNGCKEAPHPPSYVLCKRCFQRLNEKMHRLLGGKKPGEK